MIISLWGWRSVTHRTVRPELIIVLFSDQILDTCILAYALERLFPILDGLSTFAVPENVLVACPFHLEPPERFLQAELMRISQTMPIF